MAKRNGFKIWPTEGSRKTCTPRSRLVTAATIGSYDCEPVIAAGFQILEQFDVRTLRVHNDAADELVFFKDGADREYSTDISAVGLTNSLAEIINDGLAAE